MENYRNSRKYYRNVPARKPHRLTLDNGRVAMAICDLHTIPEDMERCEMSMIIMNHNTKITNNNNENPLVAPPMTPAKEIAGETRNEQSIVSEALSRNEQNICLNYENVLPMSSNVAIA
jgi:hypothetical protein